MKILIATDGSDYSKAAIDICREIIADPQNTSLKIISAFERPTPIAAGAPFVVSAEYYNEIEQVGRGQANDFIEQAAAQVKAMFPNSAPDLTGEVVVGSPQRAIVEAAKEWGADLILLGTHGYGFWSRALLGSVSNAVVHHAPCSVLVVRKKGEARNFSPNEEFVWQTS